MTQKSQICLFYGKIWLVAIKKTLCLIFSLTDHFDTVSSLQKRKNEKQNDKSSY